MHESQVSTELGSASAYEHSSLRSRSLAATVSLGALIWSGSLAWPQDLPEWRLDSVPAFDTRHYDIVLHRVMDATFLPTGHLAVADAGNHRLILLAPGKGVTRSIGRDGAGPGDFRWLNQVRAFGDTLVVYDGILNRVTRFDETGTTIAATPLPSYDERPTDLLALGTPKNLIIGTHRRAVGGHYARGLYVDSVSLFRFDLVTKDLIALEQREALEHRYFLPQERGWSVYSTPFFGRTLFASLREKYAVLPLGSTVLEIRHSSGQVVGRISLPIRNRPFRREIIERARDSIVDLDKRSRNFRMAPALLAQTVAFFDGLPSPEFVPAVRRMFDVGNNLWIEVFPLPGDLRIRWYVVATEQMAVRGYIDLPPNVTLLTANDRFVALLSKDRDDVEAVLVYRIQR